jgi:hypothetical protein
LGLFASSVVSSQPAPSAQDQAPPLPLEDNTPEGLQLLFAANAYYRETYWPKPYDRTTHKLHLGDARDLSWIADNAVHLILTSPPYWNLKDYAPENRDQMGDIADYEEFLGELDKVWRECIRVVAESAVWSAMSASRERKVVAIS